MLQSRNISNVLSQGLKPFPVTSDSTTSVTPANQPLSFSLVSPKGLPLTTVSSDVDYIYHEDLRVFSLLAFDAFQSYAINPSAAIENTFLPSPYVGASSIAAAVAAVNAAAAYGVPNTDADANGVGSSRSIHPTLSRGPIFNGHGVGPGKLLNNHKYKYNVSNYEDGQLKWVCLELQEFDLIISRIKDTNYYCLIAFAKEFPKGLAKMKLEKVVDVLSEGMKVPFEF